jgi:hypothetical protein
VNAAESSLASARQQLAGCSVEIEFAFDQQTLNTFAALVRPCAGCVRHMGFRFQRTTEAVPRRSSELQRRRRDRGAASQGLNRPQILRKEAKNIEPLHVATYIEALQEKMAKPTVKEHLAAIRMLFDWLVSALIGVITYAFARIGAVVSMRVSVSRSATFTKGRKGRTNRMFEPQAANLQKPGPFGPSALRLTISFI